MCAKLNFNVLFLASSGSERGHYPGIRMGMESLFTSRDPSAESMNSFMSTSTGNSMSPHTTAQRPHSITSKEHSTVNSSIRVKGMNAVKSTPVVCVRNEQSPVSVSSTFHWNSFGCMQFYSKSFK